jgi:hypothetical protein
MRTFYFCGVLLHLTVAATALGAQQSLTPARGTTSIITGQFDALSIDVTETALSFLNVQGQLGSPSGQERVTNTRFTIAAQKFKRDILSRGEITPGFEFEHRFTFAQHLLGSPSGQAQAPGAASVTPVPSGFRIFYAGFRGDITQVKTAVDADGEGEEEIELGDATAGTLAFNGGVNFAPAANANVWGVGFEIRRGFSTPLAQRPSNVCTNSPLGVDGQGHEIVVSDCSNRFLGGVGDEWTGHIRTDVVTRRIQIAPGDPESSTVGLIAAASANLSDRAKTTYNFALGPALYKAGSPYQVLAALLFEVEDATDARGQAEDFEDRIFIRLYLGVPFSR